MRINNIKMVLSLFLKANFQLSIASLTQSVTLVVYTCTHRRAVAGVPSDLSPLLPRGQAEEDRPPPTAQREAHLRRSGDESFVHGQRRHAEVARMPRYVLVFLCMYA
jgi:hypothetical protein